MLDIIITETGANETLSIVDQNGVDYVKDFIGHYGGFSDEQFRYDEDRDVYITDQATFSWWAKVIKDNQELENRLAALRAIFGSAAVQDAIGTAGEVDLEDFVESINNALDEAFGEAFGE